MPILKCTQFSTREVGKPGSGTVTNGCNYAKSGSIFNAEQQSWVPCWSEVRVIEMGCLRRLWNLHPWRCPRLTGCGPVQPDRTGHALSWGCAQWPLEVPSNVKYYLMLWMSIVPGFPQNQVHVFLLAMPMEYVTPHKGISALPVEGKLLSVLSLFHKLTNYRFYSWNFNVCMISTFPRHKRLLFLWTSRFVMWEKLHVTAQWKHMLLFPIASVLLHWEWLRLAWSLENNCKNKSWEWRVCLCLSFSSCCNIKSAYLADEMEGGPLHTH